MINNEINILGNWLVEESKRIIEGSIIVAFDGRTKCYTPDATCSYKALWTRDLFYIVEGLPECIKDDDFKACCEYLLYGQREDGIIPDRRYANGVSVYSAGPFEKPIGKPPTDNSQFMIKLVHNYVMRTGNVDFFIKHSNHLERAMAAVNRSEDGLVYILPGVKQSPYGFTDQIGKTGNILFSSALFTEACFCMSEMFGLLKNGNQKKYWFNEGNKTLKALDILWCEDESMYFAADIDCKQLDVWGSAYIAYNNLCDQNRAIKISKRLLKDIDKINKRGYIRHLFYPEFWNNRLCRDGESTPLPEEGTYQNGAYWSTATGWVSSVIRLTNEEKANSILLELLKDYKENGIYEAINDDPNYLGVKDYCANVTLIIYELRRIGLDI